MDQPTVVEDPETGEHYCYIDGKKVYGTDPDTSHKPKPVKDVEGEEMYYDEDRIVFV